MPLRIGLQDRPPTMHEIWEQLGNKTPGFGAVLWARTPTRAIESSSSWRKRVGVEPKLSTPNSRRMMTLWLPPNSNWSQLEPDPLAPLLALSLPSQRWSCPKFSFAPRCAAITKPSDIREVRCNQIKLFFHLPRPRHPALVSQSKGDVVFAEHIRESGIQPALVANLDGEAVALGKVLEKRP
jgi:hypothetical protein